MPMPPKVCPQCGEEYLHTASVCIHCDVALVLEGEQSAQQAPEELPPASELVCVRAASMGWAMSLSEHLVEAGIPHRVQAAEGDADEGSRRKPGQNLPFGVFVLAEHAETAAQIDFTHTERQIPDIPEDFGQSEISADDCPACGESISPTATECGECGLALLPPE
ncbi:MAG: hypothetical protein JRE38_00425 [Deltaproteobacteria bacterium]|nr:hypothetical protein [Deltaproteobacteria bacterium]MBW2576512.1 hypothetical protein [Deltaproteobacteria bacterium]